ncbi:hypothetical protein [Georgenia deserti]|uniref:DUF3017 domain-containing protein n=1 Tax=Georgenia deserti TaxID=2093781 RepID=A0ABW4KXY3_9MICO
MSSGEAAPSWAETASESDRVEVSRRHTILLVAMAVLAGFFVALNALRWEGAWQGFMLGLVLCGLTDQLSRTGLVADAAASRNLSRAANVGVWLALVGGFIALLAGEF